MNDEDNPKVQVTSFNQSGGITAQNVTISNTPPPTLQVTKEVLLNEPQNGKYLTRVEFTIVTPYPIGNLYLEARAQTVEEIDCLPMRTGWMTGHSGKRDGLAFTNIPNAYGNYQLDIITSQPDKIQVIYNFE